MRANRGSSQPWKHSPDQRRRVEISLKLRLVHKRTSKGKDKLPSHDSRNMLKYLKVASKLMMTEEHEQYYFLHLNSTVLLI